MTDNDKDVEYIVRELLGEYQNDCWLRVREAADIIRRAIKAGRELGEADKWRETFRRGQDEGAAAEREAIVAWLRKGLGGGSGQLLTPLFAPSVRYIAEDIERGAHLELDEGFGYDER